MSQENTPKDNLQAEQVKRQQDNTTKEVKEAKEKASKSGCCGGCGG